MIRKETSYGILAVRMVHNHWEIFLVKHQKGHWAFPKGHAEEGETPKETAARELEEETGGKVIRFLDLPPLEEHYSFQSNGDVIEKTNRYFFAEVEGAGSSRQEKEIAACKWLSFEEAIQLITFPEAKKVLQEASSKLQVSRKL